MLIRICIGIIVVLLALALISKIMQDYNDRSDYLSNETLRITTIIVVPICLLLSTAAYFEIKKMEKAPKVFIVDYLERRIK